MRGAVVTVGDHMTVKATTATGPTFADLCGDVQRAAKGTGDGGEQGAHAVVIQAGGVICQTRVEVGGGECEHVRGAAEGVHKRVTGAVLSKGATGAACLLSG